MNTPGTPCLNPGPKRPARAHGWRWAAWLLALAVSPALASELRFEEGIARDPVQGGELYREQHWIRSQAGQALERLVLYRCPDGRAFARKRVDYRASATAPDFALEDRRSGYREGLRRGSRPTLYVTPGRGSRERAAQVSATALVADAGFDEFIRRHWPALVAGRSQALDFAIPSRLRSLPFSLQRSGEAVIAGEKAWVFRLKLEGLLGLFAPNMEAVYGKDSRRLLQFRGLSNVRDDQGRAPLLARIDFALPSRASDEGAWAAAAGQPLFACTAGRPGGQVRGPDGHSSPIASR